MDEAYIFTKKTCWSWCILIFIKKSSTVLKLWQVETNTTDFNGDFRHKAYSDDYRDRHQIWAFFSHFLVIIIDIGPQTNNVITT